MIRSLVHAPNTGTGEYELGGAAQSLGLETHLLPTRRDGWVDPSAVVALAGPDVAYRSPGGLLAAAIDEGAAIRLVGATARWFSFLAQEITGRAWTLTDVAGARSVLAAGPAFVKLAEAKLRALPARRYATVVEFDTALAAVHAPADLALLATRGWLAIESEYRVFTIGRAAVAWSPYRVHDDPWTPLLRTHRGSFHDEAATFVDGLLAALPAADVPPTAVLDVARLDDDRFVVLEVNHVWSSGLYGCEPAEVLSAVVAAADPATAGAADRWLWRPDPAVAQLHRRHSSG